MACAGFQSLLIGSVIEPAFGDKSRFFFFRQQQCPKANLGRKATDHKRGAHGCTDEIAGIWQYIIAVDVDNVFE